MSYSEWINKSLSVLVIMAIPESAFEPHRERVRRRIHRRMRRACPVRRGFCSPYRAEAIGKAYGKLPTRTGAPGAAVQFGVIRAALKADRQEVTMKTRIFTYVECRCGHRGALIESRDVGDFPYHPYRTWLRNLTHTGRYDGGDALFAEMKPGCPACGRSLGPVDVIGRSKLQGTAEVLRLTDRSDSSETTVSAGS